MGGLAARLFEVRVHTLDQSVRIDCDFENADLVAEITREIETDDSIAARLFEWTGFY